MNVTEANTEIPSGVGLGAPANQAMGRDDFLNLLVVQLKNQDPMDPMESAEFSAQLAQFSSLEQLTNMNDNMQLLIEQQESAANTQAVSYIGRHVKADGDAVQLIDGEPVDCVFELSGAAVETVMYISDPDGNTVRSMALGNLPQGEHAVPWDGKKDDGKDAVNGIYTFEVVAIDPEGGKVPSKSFISTNVSGISLDDGVPSLMSGELRIPLTDVVKVEETAKDPVE